MNKVLLAGATGYLGGFIAKELLERSYPVRAIVRNPEKLKQNNIEVTNRILHDRHGHEYGCSGIWKTHIKRIFH